MNEMNAQHRTASGAGPECARIAFAPCRAHVPEVLKTPMAQSWGRWSSQEPMAELSLAPRVRYSGF